MNSYSDEAIVIKRSNLGEADRLLTLFTKHYGKVTVLARGVRKLSSKRAGSIELFNLIKVSFIKGRGELETLGEIQSLETFSGWRKHLGRVNLAYQMIEVVDKLTPDHQPHSEIFEILKNSLFEIENLKIDWRQKIEGWLVDIAGELGYWSREEKFTGDIYDFLEKAASRPLHSPKLLKKFK